MIKRLTLVLTVLFLSQSTFAQEIYLSISGKNTAIKSGDSRHQYDIWIKPDADAVNGSLQIFDAGLGGAVDVVTENSLLTTTQYSLLAFQNVYQIENGQLLSKQSTTQPITVLTAKDEERFKNRWVKLADLDPTNSQGYIVRITADEGDDVNSFNFRMVSETGRVLNNNQWKIISVDLSIGLFNSSRNSVFQLKPYSVSNSNASPRLIVNGEEDSRVNKMDSFGEVYEATRSALPAVKFGMPNKWGLVITGSDERINTLTVYGFDKPVLWEFVPIVTDRVRRPNLAVNEIPTQQCVEKSFELIGNDFDNAELSNARWIIQNQQVASGKTPTISSNSPGEFKINILVPNQRALLPEYWAYTKTMFINTPPVARITSSKTVISPSEPILLNGYNSYDIEGRNLTYEWFVNGSLRSTDSSFRFSSTISGNYVVRLRVSDGGSVQNCSVDDAEIEIRVNTQPYAELRVPNLFGTDEEVVASIMNQTDADNDPLSYRWEGLGVIGASNNSTATLMHSEPGIYPVTVMLNDGTGASNSIYSVTKRYEVNAAPVPTFTITEKAAPGDNITLDATSSTDSNNNPLSYKWFVNSNLIASQSVANFQFTEPGTYQVKLIVDDGRGVSNSVQELTKSININASPIPVITAAKVTSNSRVAFSAEQSSDLETDITSYKWDFGDGNTATGPSVQHTFSKTGEYRITLSVDDGSGLSNSIKSTQHTLLINQYPIADFTAPTVVAPGETFTVDGSSSYDTDGLIESYEWYNEGDLIGTGPLLTTSLNKTGYTNISLRVKDDSGYELAEGIKTKRLRVNTPPVPIWYTEANNVAPNKEIKFSAEQSYDPDGNIGRYIWKFNDGVELRGRVIQRIFRESGPKSFTLTVIDNDNLSNSESSISGQIKVNHAPLIITETLLRSNSLTVTLDASASYDLDDDPITFEWTLPDGTKRNESSFTWQASEPGVHIVGLTVDDGLGLENSITQESIRVLINRPVKAVVANQIQSCTGQTVLFNSSQSYDPDGDPFSVRWDFGNGVTSDQANPTYVYETPGIYEAELTLNDGFTEQKTVAKIPVIIEGSPVAKLDISSTTVCVNNSIRLDGSASTDPSGAIPSFSWDTGDGQTKTGPIVDHIFTKPGNYTISLTVEGSGSGRCSNISQKTVNVTVVEGPEAIFELPKYTTPGENVMLNGSASVADGGIKSAKWIIDTENKQETLDGLVSNYTFNEPGEYLVTLQLETNSNTSCNTVSLTKTIKVNAAPTISWSLPTQIAAGTDLKLDGLGSKDEDGFIVSYKWYLDNELISENAAEIIKAISPGEHTVTLEITDNSTASNNTVTQQKSFVANSKPSANIIAPERVFLNQQVTFKSASTFDEDGDALTSTWKLDGKVISNPTFNLTNPKGHTLVLIQDDERGFENSVDSASIRIIPKPLPLANPNLPKLIAVGGALSLPDISMNNPWRFKNGNAFDLTWSARKAGIQPLTLAYIQNGKELTSQDFQVQVVPKLSFTETIEPITIEWNPANPSYILRGVPVNRELGDVQYTWKKQGEIIGTGKQIGVVLAKGENRFTLQVSDQRVARSTALTVDVIIITN